MSNSILPAAGNLDIVNANVRADKFNAATNIGVANTNPDFNFSVGDKFHVDKDSTDPVSITGNVVASGIKISNLTIGPAFDFASVSNVGNVTANVIQFANATTGFTTTANVEIGGNISLTANAQVKVGSNVLAEYTGPHGREPKEVPLKKYPEIAFAASKLDGNDTTNTYTQAGYTVSGSAPTASASGSRKVWKAFAGVDAAGQTSFVTDDNRYNSSTGVHIGGVSTVVSGVSYSGDWIQIKLPKKIRVKHINFGTQNVSGLDRVPISGTIAGSTNGSDWTLVKNFTKTASDFIMGEFTQIDVDNTEYYDYYRFIAVTLVGGDTRYACQELEYYGYEEPAPVGDLSLDTTLKSTFNSVRSNNYVMYFDGEDPTGDPVVPKYLPSGTVKTITPNNITFDASNNCWSLDGSTESNVTTGDLGFEGDAPHTVSMWINASNLDANATTQQLFTIGSGYDKALVRVDDTQIAANTWHNVTYAYQGEGGSKVTYVDGRKVEEEKVEDTFGEYPPFAMTDDETGGFRASASNEDVADTYFAWKAFDNGTGSIPQVGWFSDQIGNYNGTNGTVTTTSTVRLAPETEKGEWLQLEFPYFFHLDSFTIFSQSDSQTTHTVDNLIVYAKKGLSDTWTSLGTFTGIAARQSASGVSEAVNANEMYKYFAIVITKRFAQHSTDGVTIRELKYFGHKEGDLTRFPEPTRVLKYPHILTKNGTGDGFTSATTAPEYGKRGYVIKASSSIGSYPPYCAFNGETHVATGTAWIGGYNSYGTNNAGVSVAGGYKTVGTMNLKTNLGTGGSTTIDGEWLYIEMPGKITVTSTKIVSNDSVSQPPDYVVIYGTNDPSSSGGWNVVDNTYVSSSSGIPNSANGKTWTVSTASNPVAYKYFALVIVKVNSTAGYSHAIVNDWQLIGTEEDTGTPAIVGGPFAGKVANFRVYDKYLGDERIQEIYDAQKDAFGHKKSSMTFYKGRIGVGTTEPEGALTVIDEPHALAKFPARAVSADDGQIKLSAADGSGYQAFDGLTSTSWTAAPTRNTRLSEEVDFGAWLKLQTPESVSLKKAEIESNPDWRQVGNEVLGSNAGEHFGRSVACSHDGTRVIAGAYIYNSSQGRAEVYDWNGSAWTKVGQTLTGTATGDNFSKFVAISGDGNIIAIAAPFEHVGGSSDKGTVRVYYLNGSTWTVLPDSGSLTESETGAVDAFVGSTANAYLGNGAVQLSYDGKTIAMCEYSYSGGAGRVLVYQYSNGEWSYKGTGATQFVGSAANVHFGFGLSMSEDGNCLAIGTLDAGFFVEVYTWDGSAWNLKGSRINQPSTSTGVNDHFGSVVSVSNNGNTLAIGAEDADLADGANADNNGLVFVYHWTGSIWGTPHKLTYNETDDEDFGTGVVLSGDGKRLVVSAPNQPRSTPHGELFTFEYTGGSWIMRTPGVQGLDGDVTDLGHLGWGWHQDGHSFALSRDGSTIVAGELGDDGAGTNAGRFRVFSMPSNIKSIWGSNDDTNWTKITTAPTREEATSNVAGVAFGYDDRLEFKNLDNPNYYKYHAIVADAFTRLKDVKLFGVRKQGSSTLHDGALTLTKNLDVPRIGPPPDADDTPRRDRLVVEYNTSTNPVEDGVVRDTSGRGNDGAFYGGASYNATEKAFNTPNLTGIIRKNINLPGGNIPLSVSAWFRLINTTTTTNDTIICLGTNSTATGGGSFILRVNTDQLRINFEQSSNYTEFTKAISNGRWYHVVATYDGGTSASARKLFIDGVEIAQTSTTGTITGVNLPVNPDFTVGMRTDISGYINGFISNFKLYDTVLTAQEVKTLYDMGRCDEGHHVVNFSKTRVGIGLGDGEVPRGDLDVRGEISLAEGVSLRGEAKDTGSSLNAQFDTPGLVIGETWTRDLGFKSMNGNSDYYYIGCFKFNSAVELEVTDHGNSLYSTSKYTVTKHFGNAPVINGYKGSYYVQHRFYYSNGNDVNLDYHLWLLPYFGYVQSGDYRVRYRTGNVLDQAENTSGRTECVYGLISGHYGNRVGINTTNPGHLVDINGTMRANLNYSPQNWSFYDTIGSDNNWRTAFSVGTTAIGFFSVLSYSAGYSQSNAIWYYQYKSGGTTGGVVRISGSSSPTFRMSGQTVEHNGNGGTHFTQLRVLPFVI